MRFYLKVHTNNRGRVVAACDKELAGKVHRKAGAVLDLKQYAAFYVGEEVGESEVLQQIKNFSSLNIVGKNATALAVSCGIVDKGQVRVIAGVPQVQVYRI